jgi:Mg/Co/Ni transporter MgtE
MKPKHQCFTVTKQDRLHDVLDRITINDIQAVPVLDGAKFAGMISKQMIYQAFFESESNSRIDFLRETKAEEIVSHGELHVTEEDVFEKTLTTLKGFPVLAVVDDKNHFLGIITRFEVLEQFESAFGLRKPGIRIAFTSIEEEGRISRVSEIINSFHGNVISIATFDETDNLARRIVIKIEKKENVDKLIKKLEKSGFKILDVKEM